MSTDIKARIERHVEGAVERMRGEVAELAERWRRDVLLPFCRAQRLTYLAGNGRATFDRSNGEALAPDDPLLAELMPVLNIEITHADYFGYYVDSVTKKDLRGA